MIKCYSVLIVHYNLKNGNLEVSSLGTRMTITESREEVGKDRLVTLITRHGILENSWNIIGSFSFYSKGKGTLFLLGTSLKQVKVVKTGRL